jgi:hypothetical protein
MTPFLVALVFVFAVLLVIWNAVRIRGYQRDYQYEGGFPGEPYPSELRTPDTEWPMKCLIGATDTALYLMADPQDHNKRLWWGWGKYASFRQFYKNDLRIPWTDLEFRAGKMFFQDVIWFENRQKKFYVFVPRAVGEKVLTDAGRAIPS